MSVSLLSRNVPQMQSGETAEEFRVRRTNERVMAEREFDYALVVFYVRDTNMSIGEMKTLLGRMIKYIVTSEPRSEADEVFTFQISWGLKNVIVSGTFSTFEAYFCAALQGDKL